MHANGAPSLADNRATARRRRPNNKMIYRMVTEENGANKTTTFTPADLHDDQIGDDTCMALCDMEHDRPRLEQRKITLFVGRNLPERMERSMRGFLHRPKRNKTNLVRLAHFFKRPANAHVTRQSPAAIGRPFKGGNGRGHRKGNGDFSFAGCLVECRIRNFTAHLLDVRDGPKPASLN